MAGFDRKGIGFTGYEFGTRTLAIAREAGVKLVGSMCIHQNSRIGRTGHGESTIPAGRCDITSPEMIIFASRGRVVKKVW